MPWQAGSSNGKRCKDSSSSLSAIPVICQVAHCIDDFYDVDRVLFCTITRED